MYSSVDDHAPVIEEDVDDTLGSSRRRRMEEMKGVFEIYWNYDNGFYCYLRNAYVHIVVGSAASNRSYRVNPISHGGDNYGMFLNFGVNSCGFKNIFFIEKTTGCAIVPVQPPPNHEDYQFRVRNYSSAFDLFVDEI